MWFVNSIDCEPVFEDYTGIDVTLNLVPYNPEEMMAQVELLAPHLAFYLDRIS